MFYILYKNPNAPLNKACALLLSCYVAWSFAMIFVHNKYTPKESVYFFEKIASYGWCFFSIHLISFVLIFKGQKQVLSSKYYFLFYFPPLLMLIMHVSSNALTADYILKWYGWARVLKYNAFTLFFVMYTTAYTLAALYMLISHYKNVENHIIKKQTQMLIISLCLTFFSGFTTDVIFPLILKYYEIPDIADVIFIIAFAIFIYIISRYKFLSVTQSFISEKILQTMSECFLLLNNTACIVNINQATQKLLGYEEQELLGAHISKIVKPVNRLSTFYSNIKIRDILSEEVFFKTKSHQEIIVSFSHSLLRDHEQKIAGIVCLGRDISKKKQAEKQLTKTYEELKSTETRLKKSAKMAEIGQLAAGVAHEINNPTSFIISNLEVLRGYTTDILNAISRCDDSPKIFFSDGTLESILEEIKEIKIQQQMEYIYEDFEIMLSEIENGAHRIKNIVLSLKNFSHPDTTDGQLVDINSEVKNTISLLQSELKYNCEVIIELDDVGSIHGNPRSIEQALLNIIINASQAIRKKGQIIIKTKSTSHNILIIISDTGKGIEPEDVDKIFDPFFTTKTLGDGTGLGLSITYGIIQKHGGSIDVTSELDKGTTFTITLPKARIK
ncbi:MAG: PAS domain S-box protein [Candidatus Omnitrophica bacterium]|nr:PAS domain S-box protein [Candidatus Omnitrophota bacterium]